MRRCRARSRKPKRCVDLSLQRDSLPGCRRAGTYALSVEFACNYVASEQLALRRVTFPGRLHLSPRRLRRTRQCATKDAVCATFAQFACHAVLCRNPSLVGCLILNKRRFRAFISLSLYLNVLVQLCKSTDFGCAILRIKLIMSKRSYFCVALRLYRDYSCDSVTI